METKEMKKDKPYYHQSTLTNYYICPHKMVLSKEHSIEQTEPMRNGLLFEFFALGMNPRAKEKYGTEEDYAKALIGRKTPATIDPLKKKAEFIKPIFLEPKNAFITLKYEDKEYFNGGEADYIGLVEYGGKVIECIADLKYTGSVAGWRNYIKASDYFQSVYYSYIVWKMTNKILPFLYVIVDSNFEIPIVSYKLMHFSKENLLQVKREVDFIHNDIIRRPVCSYETCVKGPYNKPCDFLEWCEYGRELISDSKEIKFEELVPDFLNPKY